VNLKIKPNSYELASKGDDVTVFLDPKITDQRINDAYAKCFYMKKYKPEDEGEIYYGLGQIAKYVKIGTIADVDFCSTTTFYAEDIKSYKIIRQIHRFFMMTAWSRKALTYTIDELKCYLHGLHLANNLWLHDMPILSTYNMKLRQDMTNVHIKQRTGLTKEIVKVEDLQSYDNLQHYLDKDFYYSSKDRVSSRKPTERDYYRYFEEKYNLTPENIKVIETEILNSDDYCITSQSLCDLVSN